MAASVLRTIVVGLCIWASIGNVARALDDTSNLTNDLQSIRVLAESGNYQEAIEKVNEYLRENPGDAEGRFLKGIIFSDQKRFEEAIEVFVGITNDFPQLPEPYNNLAVLYASRGNYQKARDALLVAIKTHPSYATAHENLGDIYAMMATEAYNKALEIDKGNESAKIKLGMIRELFPESMAGAGGSATDKKGIGSSQQEPRIATSWGKKPESPASSPAVPPEVERDVQAALNTWVQAWSSKNVEGYLASYAPTFTPSNGMSLPRWKAQRRKRILAPRFIKVTTSAPSITMLDNDRVRVRFIQKYRSNAYQDRVHKTIDLMNISGNWLFIREEVVQ
ncbi:MAG: Flp pilus assembly protein TadD, contains TPR repeats [Candidatus Kentron sp. G]|nr:MAG: Flp pilus assembly protein TadD, contains TPR repeats [Candidatus Kentron sp. G]VFN00121.1 MAG: Flp pilus assembly protein TadD, contains TPR repeats [Candidatus Kentron sp. G]VFN01703.1 MAG: Flp pilus assembly protein TadD, contains TPR repeats [Candidatus Kentron sp. G]